jgi:tRNA pseudouridine38-40 synthase
MPRWKCICAYDGTGFAGWQSQAGGAAIQDVIEARLAEIMGKPVRIHGSGRTDSGVHARAQVFHFDSDWRHGPAKLAAAFRVGLPAAIQIRSIRTTSADFHARFSARGKVYAYNVRLGDPDPFTRLTSWCVFRPLDLAAMKEAAAILQGKHDFKAFSAMGRREEGDTRRHLRRFEIRRRGRSLSITAEADGFLYKMVRSLVGALVAVGEGKMTPAQVRELLKSGRRTPAVHTAPAHGLRLERVIY